jgi:DegV family protein with EDD domain
MSKVAIVTDTVASMPQDLIKTLGIRVVPMGLTIDGKTYRDMVDIFPDEFWARFKSIKKFTSNAPIPGEFLKAFQEASLETDSIACVVISKALSAAFQSATQAKTLIQMEKPGLKIEIVDSKAYTGAEGFIAIEGARAAQSGKSLPEVVEIMHDMTTRVKSVSCLESLKYLIRSGRAPKTAYLGEMVGVKPIIGGVKGDGLTEMLDKVRGKEKCLDRIVEMVGEYSDTGKPLHAMVHYTDNIEDGKKVLEMVKAKYNCAEIYLTFQSPLSGGHTGPIVVISFYS